MASDLERAHEQLTALMVHRSDPHAAPPSGLSATALQELRELPVLVTYVDQQEGGVLFVGVDKNAPNAVLSTVDEKLRTLVGNVPMRIERVTTSPDTSVEEPLPQDAPSKTAKVRPIWGGVVMQASGSGYGTVTLIVQAADFSTNAILSAHVVGPGLTGVTVGQPDMKTGKFGDVKKNPALNGRSSDSALALVDSPSLGAKDKIWRAKDAFFAVTSKIAPPSPATKPEVLMQGAYTGPLSTGELTQSGLTVTFTAGGKQYTIKDQYVATYPSQPGDSGAPVFVYDNKPSNTVKFIGIHHGRFTTSSGSSAVFSGWPAIKTELGL
jgi:hypothetical protein